MDRWMRYHFEEHGNTPEQRIRRDPDLNRLNHKIKWSPPDGERENPVGGIDDR